MLIIFLNVLRLLYCCMYWFCFYEVINYPLSVWQFTLLFHLLFLGSDFLGMDQFHSLLLDNPFCSHPVAAMLWRGLYVSILFDYVNPIAFVKRQPNFMVMYACILCNLSMWWLLCSKAQTLLIFAGHLALIRKLMTRP